MAPHVEQLIIDKAVDTGTGCSGHWKRYWGTSHRTGKNTFASDLAHYLIRAYPEKFREVADKKGGSCSDTK